MTTTLDGESLGIILNENVKKLGDILPMPLFGTDADENEAFDRGGATRIITVEAVKVDTTANLKTFIELIESKVSGDQGTTIVYDSDFRSTFDIKVIDIDSNKVQGWVRELRYVIRMVQSA